MASWVPCVKCYVSVLVGLDVADVEIEGGEGVSLGADGAGLVLAGVVRRGLRDLEPVARRALHRESVARRRLVHWLAVLQPLQLERWLQITFHVSFLFKLRFHGIPLIYKVKVSK